MSGSELKSTRCWVEVSSAALRHNVKTIRRSVPRGTAILAVVKANAYGHGVDFVAHEAAKAGVSWFGVANLTEAIALRKSGLRQPILLLSAVLPDEMAETVRHGFVMAVSSFDEAKRLSAVAQRLRRKAHVHFKVDIGMGRLGLWHEQAIEAIRAAQKLPGIIIEGLFTHFPCSDSDELTTVKQWRHFNRVCAEFPNLLAHAANSAAIFSSFPSGKNGMVRAGIVLYGSGPTKKTEPLVRPLLSWKSRITHLDDVPAGRTISYGSTYRLRRAERHAVVAVGYADGYHRMLSNRAEVLIGGKRCPLRGRVTMDQIIVDVSRAGKVQLGDEVVLIGKQGREEITANEMADWAQTISYEIFTSIGDRVVRYCF